MPNWRAAILIYLDQGKGRARHLDRAYPGTNKCACEGRLASAKVTGEADNIADLDQLRQAAGKRVGGTQAIEQHKEGLRIVSM